jgi:hypothetical protein
LENGSKYQMLMPFPRKPFEQDQYSQTLQDLKLVPNAVIVLQAPVLPDTSDQGAQGFIRWLWRKLLEILFFWRIASPQRPPPSPPQERTEPEPVARIQTLQTDQPRDSSTQRWDNGNSTQMLSNDDIDKQQ